MTNEIFIEFLDPLSEEVIVASETVVEVELDTLETEALFVEDLIVDAEFEEDVQASTEDAIESITDEEIEGEVEL